MIPYPVFPLSSGIFTAQSPQSLIPIKGQYPPSVPGLHGSDRPGTPIPVRDHSKAGHCSRSTRFQQTWHTYPCWRQLRGIPPFPVCTVLTDLAHPYLLEATPRQVTIPGLLVSDRPGTPTHAGGSSKADHRSRSARL